VITVENPGLEDNLFWDVTRLRIF